MLMALLLLSWMWDRVVTNCSGGTETVHHYFMKATMFQNVTSNCPTGQGNQMAPCLKTVQLTPVRFGSDIGDPGTGTTVTCYADPFEDPALLPDPPVGGLAAWPWPTSLNPSPVMVMDMAGHTNSETCQ
jgi:hypothetical protein